MGTLCVTVRLLTPPHSRISPAAHEAWLLHVRCSYFLLGDIAAEDLKLRLPQMILAWQTKAIKAYKDDGGTDDWFGVPNFEAQRHWPAMIEYLGHPR
jgi:hypothetical protein